MLSYFLYHTFCVDLQFRQVLITVAQSLCQILGLSSIFLGPVWNLWVVNHTWKIYSGFENKVHRFPWNSCVPEQFVTLILEHPLKWCMKLKTLYKFSAFFNFIMLKKSYTLKWTYVIIWIQKNYGKLLETICLYKSLLKQSFPSFSFNPQNFLILRVLTCLILCGEYCLFLQVHMATINWLESVELSRL